MKNLLLLTFCVSLSTCLIAQWQPTNGPCGGKINCFLVDGSNIFTGTEGMGVFVSTDNGKTWTERNSGLGSQFVYALETCGSIVYAGTACGLYTSDDHGLTWNTLIIDGKASLEIQAIASNEEYLFIASDSLLRSQDNGITWKTMIGDLYNTYQNGVIAIHDSEIYVGNHGLKGIYKSVDYGDHFSFIDLSNKLGGNFTSFLFTGSKILAATIGPVLSSTDGGYTWHGSQSGMASEYSMRLIAAGNRIYAGTIIQFNPGGGGLYYSDNQGDQWNYLGLKDYSVMSLGYTGDRLLVGLFPGGVFTSDSLGSDLAESSNGLVRLPLRSFFVTGSNIYTVSCEEGISKSPDQGNTWTHINDGLPKDELYAIASLSSVIFAGGDKIYKSTDDGLSWYHVFDPAYRVSCFLVSGNQLYAGTNANYLQSEGGGIFLSEDLGETWRVISGSLPCISILSLAKEGNNLYAGTDDGVFVSTDNGSAWTSISNGLSYRHIPAIGTKPGNLIISAYWLNSMEDKQSAVFLSGDNGANWTDASLDLQYNAYSTSFATQDDKVITGIMNGDLQVYFSDDNGSRWSAVASGLPPDNGITHLEIEDNMVYASLSRDYYLEPSLFYAGSGIWKRPLSEMIAFRLLPDTLILGVNAGSNATLGISSTTHWVVNGSLPDWISADKFSGQGSENILFTAIKDNPWDPPRNFPLEIISCGITRHLTIIQHGKTLGISEIGNNAFQVFPNPSSGIIFIEAKAPYNKLKVYDTNGQLLIAQDWVSCNASFDLSRFGKGVYHIQLSGEKLASVRKVVVL